MFIKCEFFSFLQEEFNCYEDQDPFMQELIGHLDGFMIGFKDSLTPNNYQALIGALATQVAMQFEKVILKTNFSRVINNNDKYHDISSPSIIFSHFLLFS